MSVIRAVDDVYHSAGRKPPVRHFETTGLSCLLVSATASGAALLLPPASGRGLAPGRRSPAMLDGHGPSRIASAPAPPAWQAGHRRPLTKQATTRAARQPPRRAKTHAARLSLRLPPGEKARIEADAEAGGLSVSEVVRRRYFGAKIVPRADLKMVAQLRQVGGLLKHLEAKSGAGSPEYRRALAALADAIGRIAASRRA
jgi:hypothetical protein